MNLLKKSFVLSVALVISSTSLAEQREYKPVDKNLYTPDKVQTSIGELTFMDGMPTQETVKMAYDELDKQRATQSFLQGIQIASMEAIRVGTINTGADAAHKIVIFDQLMDNRPVYLTGNTETVYVFNVVDLERDGHVLYEVPAKSGPAFINDANSEYVTDMGPLGPDRGKGGTYLLLSPDYKDGDIADLKGLDIPHQGAVAASMSIAGKKQNIFVVQSKSYTNWVALRGFLKDGKPDYSSKLFRTGLKIYPLAKAANPPKMEFINGSDKYSSTIHANNFHFYEELNKAIQKEPIDFIPMDMRGLFASIGIVKGQEFAPDARMKKILTESVALGNAIARTIAFNSREEDTYFWKSSKWWTGFPGKHYKWLKDGKPNAGRYLDARTLFFYIAIGNTPAMSMEFIGKGSQYAVLSVDENNKHFDGAETYRITIPANAPAKDFWSIVAYDSQTRSELQTSQKFPSLNNKRGEFKMNKDGSVNIFFGPKAPKGYENNWIETVPGKSWFTVFRAYGPLKPWFDKTWQLKDAVLVK